MSLPEREQYEKIISKQELLIKKQGSEIASLQFQLQKLERMIFGARSERYIPSDHNPLQAKLDLGLDLGSIPYQEDTGSAKNRAGSQSKKKKKHPGRSTFPDHLPITEIVIEPEIDVTGWKRIGEKITLTLDYVAASLKVIKTIRPVYAEPNVETVITAPLPSRPIPKAIPEAGLLSYILVSKFIDHLPFYRLIQIFKRQFGYVVSKSTVNDWFIAVCTLLQPLYDELVKEIKSSYYLQVDESRIKVQDSDKPGALHRGYQWVYQDPISGLVCFHYRKGRGGYAPREFLADFEGYIQTDGYPAYLQFDRNPKTCLIGCMTHVRRKFEEALKNDKERAQIALGFFRELYQVEALLRDGHVTSDEFHIIRQHYSHDILKRLHKWILEEIEKVTPKSAIGTAMNYAKNQWPRIIRYIENPILKIDNNLVENSIRPLALGRKNYLFAGSHTAAQHIAMMYSFFATCKRRDVNPFDWLKDVLIRIPDTKVNDLRKLLPHIWVPSQQ